MTSYKIETDFGDEAEQQIKLFLENCIEHLSKNEIRTELIDEIIVSKAYEDEIIKTNRKYNSRQSISKGRSFVSYLKSIYNFDNSNPLYTIVIRDKVFFMEVAKEIVLQQIIGIDADWRMPSNLREKNTYYGDSPFPHILNVLLQQGVSEVFKFYTCDQLDCRTKIDDNSQIQTFQEFKRTIKKIHLKYQADFDLYSFWIDMIRELDRYIRFSIERRLEEGIKLNGHVMENIMIEISDVIIDITKNLNDYEKDIEKLRNPITKLLEFCFIRIEKEDPIYIKIIDHPKYLFRHDLLDTEPRIVGFTDILGFGEIVQEYEKDQSLNTLEKLHSALNNAITYGINSIVNSTQFHKDLFDYKLFSDCLCLSIPYYDNDEDFAYEFAFISQVLKFYQIFMLHEKFFIRGSISYGNYYSDENMIFSDALVKAYLLESKKADKPRIIIDPKIIDRIGSCVLPSFIEFGISKLFIIEKSNPDFVFLNPFNLVEGLNESMKYLSKLFEDNFSGDVNDPINRLGKSAQQLLNLTLEYSNKIVTSTYNEQNLLNKLLEEVIHRIDKYKIDENVRPKYEWYLRLIKFNLHLNDDFESYFK